MKVGALTEALRYISQVREKPDGGSSHQREQGRRDKREEHDRREGEAAPHDVTASEVETALHAFAVDSQAQANGLTAVTSGTGPGLRVVLKDGTGAVVRQFTGEEFLRLREAVTKDHRTRGKILDQKL